MHNSQNATLLNTYFDFWPKNLAIFDPPFMKYQTDEEIAILL